MFSNNFTLDDDLFYSSLMWAIFQESGNSPVVMHLLKNLDKHSDTMQLAIFENLDGMSLGE